MTDWLKSMQQTYEFYVVNPYTWMDDKLLTQILSCNVSRDSATDTLGSASFETTELIDECYIRIYLVTIQNGVKEKHPLGTFLVQSPAVSFDGRNRNISLDGYTPLIELKEKQPPLGYSILKNQNITELAKGLCEDHMRAPVIAPSDGSILHQHFISNPEDTWFSFISDLIANAKYSFALDEVGRVLFEPVTELSGMQPVWTYSDDNSSILLSDITEDRDLYGIPNVVEVVYSTGTTSLSSRIVNDNPNSPISTVNRGREILYRETEPSVTGVLNQAYIDNYAEALLDSLSTLEYKITYSHGYCPVRLGDCVMLNYTRAGITNTRAKVISQSIECKTGCIVEETAVYTTNLWR